MNTTETLRSRVDDLWAELEAHHAPDLSELDATMRALDDAAIDGTLTTARFENTKRRLLNRRRSYHVTHATGRVPGYVHEDRDGTPKPYKPLHGDKHLKRVKGGWQVKITMFGETVTSLHRYKRDAQMERDYFREYRATEAQTRRNATAPTADTSAQEAKARAIIKDAERAAEERKVALREAMKPCPITGETPPWSEVLRRPEFEPTGEPPKVPPR